MHHLPFANQIAAALLATTALFAVPRTGQTVEQFDEFLSGLRERGYFDVAFDYLDSLQESNLISAEQHSTLPYERAVTHIEASRVERDPVKRTRLLDKSQQGLQAFLSSENDHRYVSSARRQLGNVLVERARMNLAESEKAEAYEEQERLRQTARKQFGEAQKAFAGLEEDLREKLKGLPAHINQTQQSDLHDTRTEYRQQYLQSLLLGATIQYEKVATIASDSPERDQWLTEAADKFDEIYQKYRNWLAGRYALLYQARCFQDLGRIQDALAMYTELILQEDDSPSYRKLKTKALQSAIECWIGSEENKFSEAILQGSAWSKQMRPNEGQTPEWLEFRLALARAYLAGADAMVAEDPAKPQIKQHREKARNHARAVARQPGPLRKQAQEILAQFSNTEELPVASENFETFSEARAAGWEWLQQSQNVGKLVNILHGRLQHVESDEQRAKIETQKADAEKAIPAHRQSSLHAYRAALRLADESVSNEDLNAVRYYLSFLHYQVADYYDAVVMSELVVRYYPDSGVARRCAKIALASYFNLLQGARARGDGNLRFETESLQSISRQIVKKWPKELEAQEALVILINIAIQEGQFDIAEQSLQQIPTDAPQRGEAELKTGQALWNRYLVDSKQLRDRVASDEPPSPEEVQHAENILNELKRRAKKILEDGVERMKASSMSATLAAASLSLAQIYLDTQEPDRAIDLLEDPEFGSLALVEQNDRVANRQNYAANTYKTALRAYISSLGNAAQVTDANRLLEKAEQIMTRLEQRVGDSQTERQRLIAIYVGLASDLEQQISLAPVQSRPGLSKGFEIFLLRVVSRSSDLKILRWSAEMFYRLGKGNDSGHGQVAGDASQYYQRALTTYDKILQLEDVQGDANLDNHLRIRKATIHRRTGEFETAMKLFEEFLTSHNAMITIQVEAALTLQEWGDAEKPDKYALAMQGFNTSQNSRGKTVWGWATIARKTNDEPEFSETYYQARHHLAYCRYRWGMSQDDKKRAHTLKRAKQDITWTAKFHPELGGDNWKAKYDALLKKIQRALNEKPIGLEEVNMRTASKKAG